MAEFKPGSCDVDVSIDPGDIVFPKNCIEKWACACVVEDDTNTAHVHVLTLIDQDTLEVKAGPHYYTVEDGVTESLDPALIPLVGDCICEEMEPEPEPIREIEKWSCACVVDGDVNTEHVHILNTINADTREVIGTYYYTYVDGVLTPLDPALIPQVGDCICDVQEEEADVEVNVDLECNEATGFFDAFTVTVTDDVPSDPVVAPTILPCTATPAPVVDVEVDHICNEVTNLYDKITTTVTNGVSDGGVTTVTAISCDLPIPVVDVEVDFVCDEAAGFYNQITTTVTDGVSDGGISTLTSYECNSTFTPQIVQTPICDPATNTIHIVTTSYLPDGTPTLISDVDTGEACQSNGTEISNDCPDSIPVKTCPDSPLDVNVVDSAVKDVEVNYNCNQDTGVFDQVVQAFNADGTPDGVPTTTPTTLDCTVEVAPVVEADTEFECNPLTNFLDQILVVTTDGVTAPPVVTATTLVCGVDEAPVVENDFQYVCNETTGLYDYVQVVTTDGVAAAPIITPSTYVCDSDKLDFEQVRRCNATTNTVEIVTSAIAQDQTIVELFTYDTGEKCSCAQPFTPECLVKRTIKVGWDNGVTPGSSTNNCGSRVNFIRYSWDFEVISWSANTQLVGAGELLENFGGWTPQLQGWADFFNLTNPNGPNGTATATAAFGFDPSPTWRFAEVTDCDPRAIYGPLKIKRTDGCIFTVYPILESASYEYAYRYATLDCEGNKTIVWCDEDGNTVAAPANPECFVPCGYAFGEYIDGVSPCETADPIFACWLDADNVQTEVAVIVTDCPDEQIREVYTSESYLTAQSPDDLIEFDITGVGELVNCETGEPVVIEEPKTLEDALTTCGDEGQEATCAFGSSIPNDNVWQISESGIFWDLCGTVYNQTDEGDFSNTDIANWITANTPYSATVVDPDPANPKNVIFYISLPCDCATAPTFTFGDDAPNPIPAIPEYDMDAVAGGEGDCALKTVGCNDDRRDDALEDLAGLIVDCGENGSIEVCADTVEGSGSFDLLNQGFLPASWGPPTAGAASFTSALDCGRYNEPNPSIFEIGAVSFSPNIPATATLTSVKVCFTGQGAGEGDGTGAGVTIYQPSSGTGPYLSVSGANTELIGATGDPVQATQAVLDVIAEQQLPGLATPQDYEVDIDLATVTVADLNNDFGAIILVAEDQNFVENLRLKVEYEDEPAPALNVKVCNETKIDLSDLIEAQNQTNDLLQQLIDCMCGPCPDEGDGLGDPIGDQVACANEKMGADITSNAANEATHAAGSLYTGTGPLVAWIGSFEVTDALGAVHALADGATITGLAPGSTQQVTFTGEIEFVKDGETFRCPVTDKPISANFVVQ